MAPDKGRCVQVAAQHQSAYSKPFGLAKIVFELHRQTYLISEAQEARLSTNPRSAVQVPDAQSVSQEPDPHAAFAEIAYGDYLTYLKNFSVYFPSIASD